MKEEWLMPGAIVPVNPDTTKALVDEIKRLIDVVGGLVLKQGPDYERGFIDGMQKQAQSSVDKAVNAMSRQAEKQEPVAWGVFEGNLHDMFFTQKDAKDMARLKGDHAEVKPLYATPQPQRERVIFPTMLRKMWSGGEVQAWLDENVNKEKNHG